MTRTIHLTLADLKVTGEQNITFQCSTMGDAGKLDLSITFNIHELLNRSKRIGVLWSAEDVFEVRPDLSEDQALEVLYRAGNCHDATQGINWEMLELIAEDLFPEPPSEEDT